MAKIRAGDLSEKKTLKSILKEQIYETKN